MAHSKKRDPKAQILKLAEKVEGLGSAELVEKLGFSRQMAARYLANLVQSGVLRKEGSTRAARYFVSRGQAPAATSELHFSKNIKGLEEDTVFAELSLRVNL